MSPSRNASALNGLFDSPLFSPLYYSLVPCFTCRLHRFFPRRWIAPSDWRALMFRRFLVTAYVCCSFVSVHCSFYIRARSLDSDANSALCRCSAVHTVPVIHIHTRSTHSPSDHASHRHITQRHHRAGHSTTYVDRACTLPEGCGLTDSTLDPGRQSPAPLDAHPPPRARRRRR